MSDLEIGDVRYLNKTPVAVKSIQDEGYAKFVTVQWFEETTLREETVHESSLLILPVYPSYLDYLKFLEHHDMLCDTGSSDTLTEFMLNDAVTSLEKSLAKYNISHDEIVDAVYDVMRDLEDSFKYLEDCNYADGYEAAVLEAKHLNEDVGKRMMQDVLEVAEERKGN